MIPLLMEETGLQQKIFIGAIPLSSEAWPHRFAGAEQLLVGAVGVPILDDIIHGCEDVLRLFLDLPLFVVRKGLRHIVSPPLRREVDLQLDAELLGQRVLDGEAVIPIGDLAQTANEARLVQRHDLLALGDAGGRKSIAAQADVRRQSCCFAVARQRYGRDDGAEVVCHVVGHDNDGTGAVLDMAGCDLQICEPKLHRVNSDLLIHVTHHFAKVLKQNGLPHIRFHELRHSCASLLINNGCGLKDVQEWMGHSDIQMTANIYGHLDTARKQGLAEKLTSCLVKQQ